MMAGTAKKVSDKGLSRLKRALERGENPLSAAEVDFVLMSCGSWASTVMKRSPKSGGKPWRAAKGR